MRFFAVTMITSVCACHSAAPTGPAEPAEKAPAVVHTPAADKPVAAEPLPEYPRPVLETKRTSIRLALPEVPTLAVPPPTANGHSVSEMRLDGRKFLGTRVDIEGVIIWIYDCVTELREPGKSVRETRKRIANDPSLCNRPHFFLADRADASERDALWVVEVPRKLRPDEKKHYTRAEIAAMPPVPKLRVGQRVVVTGMWDRRSPKGFANSDGLLVYEKIRKLR